MHGTWYDLRAGIRSLRNRPGFSVAVIALLTLGLGCNTAIFTLINAVFLHPLPVTDPENVLALYRTNKLPSGEYKGFENFSYLDAQDIRERSNSFSGLALYQWTPMNFSGGEQPDRITGMFVSANYFDVLGLKPYRGRFFAGKEDEGKGTNPLLVLSYGCWQRLFGGDPSWVGRQARLNGYSFTVIGIAPPGFHGSEIHVGVDAWLPISMYTSISAFPEYYDLRGGAAFRMIGRLKPGISESKAQDELTRIGHALAREFPEDDRDTGIFAQPLLRSAVLARERDKYVGYAKTLMTAVILILLVACINVANLLLVRGIERQRELAIYQALGADRRWLVRRLLLETGLLFAAGGLLSIPVGRWSLALLWKYRPPEFLKSEIDFSVSWPLLLFAAAVTLVTCFVFGLIPALRASRPNLITLLRDPASIAASRTGPIRTRSLLVASQLALAFVALLGADLLLGNLRQAQAIDLGFKPQNLLAITLAPGDQGQDYTPEKTRVFYQRLLDRVRSIRGVESASLSENRLLRGAIVRIQVFLTGISEQPLISGDRNRHRVNVVVPGFFRTAGIPLVAGRDFSESADCPECPGAVVINRTMAETVWPGESAIGKHINLGDPSVPSVQVVGVVENTKIRYIQEAAEFFLYRPLSQEHRSSMVLHVRTAEDPASYLPVLRKEIQALDRNLPLGEADTMPNFVRGALWMEHMSASLLGLFGLLSLALAVVGIYGMMSYSVAQRRREIGLRLALGASRFQVLSSILLEAAFVVGLGVLVGWPLAFFGLKPVISGQLHGVSAADPLNYAIQALLLAATAILSSCIPARRAAVTSPASSLRAT